MKQLYKLTTLLFRRTCKSYKILFAFSAQFLLLSLQIFAQDFSNKGKDFWLGYGYHIRMNQGNSQDMKIYITSDVNTTGTVTIPGNGWSQNFTVTANQITEVIIPKSGSTDARLLTEGKSNLGIHVVTAKACVVYTHIYDQNVSGSTVCLPTPTLGREYYSVNYTQKSNENNSNSWFFVVATEDNTQIEITPSANTTGGWTAGTTYTVTLNKGQIYNVLGIVNGCSGGGGGGNNCTGVDLTGSKIKSVPVNGQCNKIAVYCGSGKISIGCTNAGSSDNLIQQMYPVNTWGKTFLTAPAGGNQSNNYYRIVRTNPASVVTLNGTSISTWQTAGSVSYYEFNNNIPNYISSTDPIIVAQYFTTQGCSGNGSPGDPEMIYLNPIEQTISNVTLNSNVNFAITVHYINVIVKNAGTALSSFRIDGMPPTGTFITHPANTAYSYIQIPVNGGAHNLKCDTPFTAIAYGFGNAESYGYSAGVNLKDQYQFISTQNEYATTEDATACVGSPFYFAVTLPYQPTLIKWQFNGLFPDVTLNNPVADSTYIRNGRQVWRYKLPSPYVVGVANYNPGYPITITTTNPTDLSGCTGEQDIDFDLLVYNPPSSGFNWIHSGCITDSVSFRDTSNPQGSSVYIWQWNFGDPASGVNNTSSLRNPMHLFSAAGTYKVKLTVITTAGCISLTDSAYVTITNVPTAIFSPSSPQCVGRNITLNDASTITAPGSISQWSWNFGDGSASIINNSNASVTHVYNAVGNYYATLQVKTNTGCTSKLDSVLIVVNPNPVADFSLPNVCMPVGAAQFNDLSTISDNTQLPFTYLWNFGDPASGAANTSTSAPGIHYYSSVGTYNVSLTVTSNKGCYDDSVKVLSSVFARPIAAVNSNSEVCVTDSIQFTSASTAAGQTIQQYYWDFGDATNLGAANYATGPVVKIKWPNPGTYIVKHWVLTSVGCYSDTIPVTIVVHPRPDALFNISSPACETKPITFTSVSLPNVGSITRWQWTLGDGRIVDTTAGGPFTHIYGAWGNYPVTLIVTNSKGCVSTLKLDSARIHPQPVPDYILPEVCLSDAYAEFINTTTIADGTQGSIQSSWNFDDPSSGVLNTSLLNSPRHKYYDTGIYMVTLTVTSIDGCVADTTKAVYVNGAIPKAGFEVLNGLHLCSNDTVRIRDTSTVDFGNITRLKIYWGDGDSTVDETPNQFPNGKIYAHKYPYFGSPLTQPYTITMLSYSGGICYDPEQQVITLNASPEISFTPPGEICEERIPFIMHYASDIWGIPGAGYYTGAGITQDSILNPRNAGVGTHSITYTYISNVGCRADSTRTFTINPQPLSDFSFNRACLPDGSAAFFDKSSVALNQVPFTYKWDFGDPSSGANNSSTTANPVHVYSIVNSYNVMLITFSSKGCSDTSYKTYDSVYAQPKAIINPRAVETCFGNSITFTDNSDGITRPFTQWLWQFGDGSTSTDKNPPPKTYSEPKTYIVKLSGFTDVRCPSSVDSIVVKVDSLPTPDFQVSNPRCEKNDITFTDISTPNTGYITNWKWDMGDGIIKTFSGSCPPFIHVYSDSNYYDVTLEVTTDRGCKKKTGPITIFVAPLPVADAGGPYLWMLEGGVLKLPGDRSRGRGLSYLWTPDYKLSSTVIATPNATPPDDIYYLLKVTSQEGCTDTAGVYVKVLKYPVVPNLFTPNGDGINDRWVIQYLDTYPGCTVEIYTPAGQLIYRNVGYATPWDGTRNGKPLPDGTYYYIIDPKNGRKVQTGSVTIIR
jgi:gliding motility-associated-like protein